MAELAKTYDPKAVEGRIYSFWLERNLFAAPGRPDRETYCIVIPPPNVTGALHMGHALNNTLQDILIRWKRMSGFAALWQPGTDHAGIATQNVVEREILQNEGKKRHDIGREALIERIWKWREKYGDRILMQLRSLGASCDWDRTRFTLDEGLSLAVREAFTRLYDEGLIYRGKYIVNWCPRCRTALADDEVDHKDEKGHLWHIRYPFADGGGHVTVATTRPETLLGDTAVAVNPTDKRFSNLVGRMLVLPETGRHIPVIADDFVDASFGTGAVKVTPAHDPNDFQIGERHNLPRINVMNEDATMNDEAGEKYRGLTRDVCRKKIVGELERAGLLEKVEEHAHAVGHCYRCHTAIEPWLSDQWFVKMRPLAEAAIRATEEGKVRFHPERWTQFYMQWLENARDWCISRQIWWGHRIPVWYCLRNTKDEGRRTKDDRSAKDFSSLVPRPSSLVESACPPIVAREAPSKCPHCGGTDVVQDEDVLDTWFSSALWPFSTLGWPEDTPMLRSYYPTKTLVTDRGIIYFWVARMVMMGLKMMGKVPFSDVYIHGTILDEMGRKMSKSLGNGIDPMDIIDKYGADAMRFSLVVLSTEGQDLKLSESKFDMGRNFSNKLWNAARFSMMNIGDTPDSEPKDKHISLADKWIIHRLHQTAADITRSMDDFKFSNAAQALYRFVWNDFCDWYLEATKLVLNGAASDEEKAATRWTLRFVLLDTLKLLHPFMPFITEELWQNIAGGESIMVSRYPKAAKKVPFEKEAAAFDVLCGIIAAIRNIRGEHSVRPSQKIAAIVRTKDKSSARRTEDGRDYIVHLSRLEKLDVSTDPQIPKESATAVVGDMEIFIPYAGLIDVAEERARLTKEITRADGELDGIRRKLSNESFVSKAPPGIVEREKRKLSEAEQKRVKLGEALAKLG